MDVHHVADDEGPALVTAQHAGRERPCDLQLADIGRGNLVELGLARIGVVARRHHPVLRVLRHLDKFVVGQSAARGQYRDGTEGC